MTKSIKSLKTVWQTTNANTLASEDIMSLPTSITQPQVGVEAEAELALV